MNRRYSLVAFVVVLALLLSASGALAQGPASRGASLATGTWSATGALATGRQKHTATLLPDGRVLIVGGYYYDGSLHYLASAEVYDPVSGTWSATGSLTTARYSHTATLLPDGRVLVAGGFSGGYWTASAEVYDPAAGTWSTTGTLINARYLHTATLLPDGRVLVVGGVGDSGYLTSAEVYDPAAGTWSPTGSLATGRHVHTATLLPNGRVLVAGGYGDGGSLASAEVYNPAAGTWSATGSLNAARDDHTATLLPDGRVLVAGGYYYDGSPHFLASTEVYNPVAGTWSTTGNLADARIYHTATLLPNGRVLVAGGYDNGSYTASAEVYDPAGGTWSATGSLSNALAYHTATLLPDGQVLVAGGGYYDGSTHYPVNAEVFSPAAGAWSNAGNLDDARIYHTATLLPDGQVLVAGGETCNYPSCSIHYYLASAEVYNPPAGTWSATGDLAAIRSEHTATLLPDGRVLVVGGVNYSGDLASVEVYDPAAETWSAAGPLATARRQHTATLLADGRVLVVGGTNGGSALASAEVYDPRADAWSAAGVLATARYQHTATLLPDGRVLVAGGFNSSGSLASAEVYDPVTGTWSATGILASVRRRHTATLLPDGRVLVAGGTTNSYWLTSAEVYDPAASTWSATDAPAAIRSEHTATLLPDGQVLVAGGWNGTTYLASAEVYDPAAGNWSTISSLDTGRCCHTATLLPDGRVLVAGGEVGSSTYGLTAKVYDRGLGFLTAWRPTLTTATSPLYLGSRLQVGGSGFRGHGFTEASGGNSQNSATNYPLVQLRRLDNEQVRWLRPDPAAGFSATAFTSVPVTDFPQGPALVTVFVNGIPGSSRVVVVIGKEDTTTTITAHTPNPSAVGQAVTVQFSVTSASGTPTGNVTVSDGTVSCVGTVAAGSCTLTFTSAGTKTLTAAYAGDASFNGSTSAGVTHTVKADTTTTITAHTPDPSAVGQAVTVQFSVTSASGTPTGNVTVSDGTVSCVGTVAAGSCTLTFTSAGTKTLTAVYAGDANFNGSTSAGVTHTVNYRLYLPLVLRNAQ